MIIIRKINNKIMMLINYLLLFKDNIIESVVVVQFLFVSMFYLDPPAYILRWVAFYGAVRQGGIVQP